MKTLEQLSEEYKQNVINRQLEILKNCARGEYGYNFVEDNLPPVFRTIYLNDITGNPSSPYSESAPHWKPNPKKLSKFILESIKSKKIDLPIHIDNPLRQNVYVLDRNGIISVLLYISDAGINCAYSNYSIVDTLVHFLGRNIKLNQIEPFYQFRDKPKTRKNSKK